MFDSNVKNDFEEELYNEYYEDCENNHDVDNSSESSRKNAKKNNILLFLFSVVFIFVGAVAVKAGFENKSDSMIKQGVYTMTAAYTDYEWDEDADGYKELCYHLYYTSDDLDVAYKESIDEEIYDSFNNGTYTNTVVKSYWMSPDGSVTRFSSENATEEEVAADVARDSLIAKIFGCIFVGVGLLPIAAVMREKRKG